MKKIYLLFLILLIASCTSNRTVEVNDMLSYDNTTFEYGTYIKLSEIFTNKDIKVKGDYLDTSTMGEKSIDIYFIKDDVNYKEKFTYNIVDTTEPLIWLSDSYTITVGDDTDLVSKIICADNEDQNPNCYINGEYDYNTPGTYKLEFVAEDRNGNQESIKFNLYVKNPSNDKKEEEKESTEFQDVVNAYKNEKTMIGIDVSKYQGDIDFKKVKSSGVEFVMIRFGLGYDNEIHMDEKFEQNIKGALENNLKVGLYFYSYAITKKEAIDQAKYLVRNIKKYNIEMPIAFDWENFSHFNEYNISLYDLQSISNSFLKVIKDSGYRPVHYGSKNYLNAFWNPVLYDTWLAHYIDGNSDYDKNYIMWQLCDNGKVNGINGDVDIDVYYEN